MSRDCDTLTTTRSVADGSVRYYKYVQDELLDKTTSPLSFTGLYVTVLLLPCPLKLLNPSLDEKLHLLLCILNLWWRESRSSLILEHSILIPMMYSALDQNPRLAGGTGPLWLTLSHNRSRPPWIDFTSNMGKSRIRDLESSIFIDSSYIGGFSESKGFTTDDARILKVYRP